MNSTHQDQSWEESLLGEGAGGGLEGEGGQEEGKEEWEGWRQGEEEKPQFTLLHNRKEFSEIFSPLANSSCWKSILTKHRTERGGCEDVQMQKQEWLMRWMFVCFVPVAPEHLQQETTKLWDVVISLVLFLVKSSNFRGSHFQRGKKKFNVDINPLN